MLYSLLSPAKRQCSQLMPPTALRSEPFFKAQITELISYLKEYSVESLAELMQISPALAELNYKRFQSFNMRDVESSQCHPALYLFQGDVYQGLAAQTWNADECEYAQMCLGILSGLYGWLKPMDLIQPYRLEMKTRLVTRQGQDLYQYWGQRVTQAIDEHLKCNGFKACVNLASIEYARVIQFEALSVPVVHVVFKEPGPKGLRWVALRAKKARGMMAAYCVRNQIQSREALQTFSESGYVYAPHESDESTDVFIRAVEAA